MQNRLVILHGNSLAYKAYYSISSIPKAAEKKESVLLLFARIVIKIISEYQPTHCAAVFEKPAPREVKKSTLTFRALHPAMSISLIRELHNIKKILLSLKIPIFEKPDYKASDIIAKFALLSSKENIETVIVSNNREILQLISPYISLVNPFRGYRVYTAETVEKEFGIEPAKIPDFLALVGEKDGNIPGIAGIGEKYAQKLLQEYGSLESILQNANQIKEEKKRLLIEKHSRQLLLYRKIAEINKQVPLEFTLHDLRLQQYDSEEVKRVFKNLGLINLLLDLIQYEKPKNTSYQTVLNEKELNILIRKLTGVSELSIDTEATSPSPTQAEIVGISLSWKEKEAYYIPLKHQYLGVPKQLKKVKIMDALRPVLENPEIKKVGQNIKYDYIVLKRAGVNLEGISFDTMIASYLLNPVRGEHNLSFLALKHFGYRMLSYRELVKDRKSIAEVEIEKVTQYACEDADFTLRLKGKLLELLQEERLLEIFQNIELPLIPILAEMEISGVKVDVDYLVDFSKILDKEIRDISEKVYELAGERFNLNSPQQLSEILFNKLGLLPSRKLKTGYSTSSSVLRCLADKHPIASKILRYRELFKLKEGFVEPLINSVNPETGRIHTSFHQIGTSTGRLASSNPNLQNIPIRGERGKELRRAFIAQEGNLLLSADYSQIELRIMAHFSEDRLLLDAFHKGKDIHTETASRIFNIPEDKVGEEERRRAKTVNFGILYGISPYGLAEAIGVDEKEAEGIIKNYFSTHPQVREFIDRTLKSAREKGYVTTLMGRKRYIPNINSANSVIRSQAEREATNTPIQGSAAEVIKLAMIRIYNEIQKRKLNTKMLLQIHDELLFEVPKEEVEVVLPIIEKCMEKAVVLKVPLKVSINTGANWFEAH